MIDFGDDTSDRELYLNSSVKELDKINKKIAELLVRKEELTEIIIGALGHEHEGQKSYQYNAWKIEVKTPFVYSLDKKKYESGQFKLPKKYNPIKESISYSIDKKMCDHLMHDAPEEIRDTLIDLIDKKPGKASVTIKERI